MATEKTTGRQAADYGDQVAERAMSGQTPACPARPVPGKPEQPA